MGLNWTLIFCENKFKVSVKSFLILKVFMNFKKITLLSVLLLVGIFCFGQTADPVKDTVPSTYSLTINLNYSTNTVFVGRKDVNYKSFLNPSLTYMNKTGIFVAIITRN